MKSGQYVYNIMMYSGNQRLHSAGNNDRRSKRFCSNAVLCISFTWQMVKTRVIRIRVIEGPNVHDQIALCAFYSFLVEVQMNAGYIHATQCVITTLRLGLRAPLVADKNSWVIHVCTHSKFVSTSVFSEIMLQCLYSLHTDVSFIAFIARWQQRK